MIHHVTAHDLHIAIIYTGILVKGYISISTNVYKYIDLIKQSIPNLFGVQYRYYILYLMSSLYKQHLQTLIN